MSNQEKQNKKLLELENEINKQEKLVELLTSEYKHEKSQFLAFFFTSRKSNPSKPKLKDVFQIKKTLKLNSKQLKKLYKKYYNTLAEK